MKYRIKMSIYGGGIFEVEADSDSDALRKVEEDYSPIYYTDVDYEIVSKEG